MAPSRHRDRTGLRRAACGGASVAFLAWASTCWAASSVQVPPDCGSREEFESEVLQRLGGGLAMPRVALDIAPEGSGYRLRMNVNGEARELRDVECRELFRAAVVVTVAMTLSHAPPRAAPKTTEAPSPEARTVAATGSTPSPARDHSDLELRAALGAGFDSGLLPGAAIGLELFLESEWRERIAISLSGRYLARRTVQDEVGRGLVVDAFGAQALGRYRLSHRLQAGLGAAAYRLDGDGLGSGRRSDHAWAAGPTVEVGFEALKMQHFWLGLSGELRWNVLRPRFEFLNYGPIFTASHLDFLLFLRLGPRFH